MSKSVCLIFQYCVGVLFGAHPSVHVLSRYMWTSFSSPFFEVWSGGRMKRPVIKRRFDHPGCWGSEISQCGCIFPFQSMQKISSLDQTIHRVSCCCPDFFVSGTVFASVAHLVVCQITRSIISQILLNKNTTIA